MGPVEGAIRDAIADGETLDTHDRHVLFRVEFEPSSLVLVLGSRARKRCPIAWPNVESTPGYLRGRGLVIVGGSRGSHVVAGSLDALTKEWFSTDVARWLAVVLERAGVVEIVDRPLSVRLTPRWRQRD